MVTIAVDAMGGDSAHKAEIEGAIRAARSYGVQVILVGREDVLREELARHDGAQSLPINSKSRFTKGEADSSAALPAMAAACFSVFRQSVTGPAPPCL